MSFTLRRAAADTGLRRDFSKRIACDRAVWASDFGVEVARVTCVSQNSKGWDSRWGWWAGFVGACGVGDGGQNNLSYGETRQTPYHRTKQLQHPWFLLAPGTAKAE